MRPACPSLSQQRQCLWAACPQQRTPSDCAGVCLLANLWRPHASRLLMWVWQVQRASRLCIGSSIAAVCGVWFVLCTRGIEQVAEAQRSMPTIGLQQTHKAQAPGAQPSRSRDDSQRLVPVACSWSPLSQHPYACCCAPRRTCHIVVGTPGRLCALVSSGALLLGKLQAAVLDEADQLLSENFYGDVAWLLQQLPARKQVCRAALAPCLQETCWSCSC